MNVISTPPAIVTDIPVEAVAGMISKSADWHAQRRRGLGGSDAARVMAGDWLALWEEKTGRREAENLDDILPVVMGTWTEPLNRYWFQKQTGMVVDLGNVGHIHHPQHAFMRANLDGRVGMGLFEAKHTNAFAKLEDAVAKYYPQVQHNMACAGEAVLYLSVFFGNLKWDYATIDADPAYQAELIAREAEFWAFVETDCPPPCVAAAEAPTISLDDMREVDAAAAPFANRFGDAAHAWADNKRAAKTFDIAAKDLKSLVEPDVKRLFGFGVEITRSKAGALTIKEA